MKKVVRAFSSVTLHSLDSATGVVGVGLHWFRGDNRLRPYRKLLPFCSLFLRFFRFLGNVRNKYVVYQHNIVPVFFGTF